MADIFLSYSQKDRIQAVRIRLRLQDLGWNVWLDARLIAGEHFATVIQTELRKARCVVVLWSTAALESNWVSDEAAVGRDRKILVPIAIEPIQPPLGFRSVHTADLSDWDGLASDEEFLKMVASIKRSRAIQTEQ